MKLNLGCGYNHMEGWTNVDSDPECKPDLCFDITKPNWPIEDNTVEVATAEHVLEHLEGIEGYKTFWQELYRVCKNDAIINIEVPHWEHDTFHHDPTHCRKVTPIGIAMMDQQRNQDDLKNGGRETKLGFMWHIDFAMQGVNFGFDNTNALPMVCYYGTKVVKPARYVQ